ncbi:MOSC domain-containing protein [Streptacidiphilus sp. P02-A3a]|uniref:MOSC domain-containing protein n=1 Tax=Streptacidiphilus sp. P02-A3a TaxID=2704468 RepID=UPI0015F9150A|nr:MOSC domain-containing protein [Streptacidiphilus sp. P02-A3a]QMU72691.1 MOSC domain-containing protein [Streptacidiphilus sp. P02-A3a]
MGKLLSLNVGRDRASEHTDIGRTAIDKRPVEGPLAVVAPGPRGTPGSSGSALAGDQVCDDRHHGGDDQAVYAYSREELDLWQRELGRDLHNGSFGENLTTVGVDTTDALIGERWRIGPQVVLEVCATRIPCRTFQGWLEERHWMKRFTRQALPGAYLRVITPGEIRAGDEVAVLSRPTHRVTSGVVFRALTLEPDLLPLLLEVPELGAHQRDHAAQRLRG